MMGHARDADVASCLTYLSVSVIQTLLFNTIQHIYSLGEQNTAQKQKKDQCMTFENIMVFLQLSYLSF